MDAGLIAPHGGTLVNAQAGQERNKILTPMAQGLFDIILNDRQTCDLELIACGALSPLQGFMTRIDYEAVLDRMSLADGTFWPMPVCLDVDEKTGERLEVGQSLALRDQEGFLLAVLHLEDLWPVDKEREANKIFGIADPAHYGFAYLMNNMGRYYLGGKIELINMPVNYDFKQLRLTPQEVRYNIRKLGWQRVAGLVTRSPLHRPHVEMTLATMREIRANLLVMPVVGITRAEDYDYYTRVRCYRSITGYYPPDSVMVSLLPFKLREAGPREALLQAIIAKNYGATHFIVGPQQASPPSLSDGTAFYEPNQAKDLAMAMEDRLGLKVVTVDEMVYCPSEDKFCFEPDCPPGTQSVSMSNEELRLRIRTGRKIPEWASYPEVIRELRRAFPPPRKQGITVFLTGLSGAGKSTIAKILYARFMEIGDRPVTLLDGDIVRRNLSSELGFSKEHRDINVRRIGYVASEITKNRGIAICAPIAPYAQTRLDVRREIERYGGFIEVFVSTPLEVCELRDRKGMYAKARAGLIQGFTGVDDPYMEPVAPEIKVDTTNLTPEEAAQEILLFMGHKGYI